MLPNDSDHRPGDSGARYETGALSPGLGDAFRYPVFEVFPSLVPTD
jgi:hypothetical protein